MNPERYARLKEILLSALALPVPERSAYLDQACGCDAGLREDADALLRAEGCTAGVLSPGALDEAIVRSLNDARGAHAGHEMPDRIGPFRILGLLGEGGMGTVYRARQEVPVQRDVALKVIQGIGSAGVLARFESERQALAGMNHPGIARLLDAGSTTDGRPWFAMELIEGVPITTFARTERCGTDERLRLLLDVCRAVRHAHRKGVIHRDLKPSNVLVAMAQDRPVPKVIDFSIARALGESLVATEHRTRTGQMMGTVEYMSPEQARGDVRSVDTRSDVYSLGVLIYEVLTDRLPYDVAGRPLHEAVKAILEDPPWPLRRAGTSTRRINPDVETIVLKCLEKHPDRRYGSAADLVDDLERLLSARPILARPPSTFYNLRMLVRRHRVFFGFAAMTFVFLLGYGVTVSVELRIQSRERARAEESAGEARRAAAKAERINNFLQDLLTSPSPGDMGRDVTVRAVLDRAGLTLEKSLADEPEARADAHRTLATTYCNLGDLDACMKHQEQALAIRRSLHAGDDEDLAQDLVDLAMIYAVMPGRAEDARRLGLEGIAMWRRVTQEPRPELAKALADMAWRLNLTLSRSERERMARESVAMWEALHGPEPWQMGEALHLLGLILHQEGKYREAEANVRRGVEILDRTLGPGHAATIDARGDLGVTELDLPGMDDESLALLRDTLDRQRVILGPDHLMIACYARNLALWQLRHDRFEEAQRLFEEARGIFRRVYGDTHRDLAREAGHLAAVSHARGEYAAAEVHYREMMSQYERLGVPPDAVEAFHFALLLHTIGRDGESEALLRSALDREQRESMPLPRNLVLIRTALGCIALDTGRLAEADELLESAREAMATMEDEEGCVVPFSAVVLARLRDKQGRTKESAALIEQVADRLSYCVPRAAIEWRHLLPVTTALLEAREDKQMASRYRDAEVRLDRIVKGGEPEWWKEGAGRPEAETRMANHPSPVATGPRR